MPDSGGDSELRKTGLRHTRNNSQKKKRRIYFLSSIILKILLILNIKGEAGFLQARCYLLVFRRSLPRIDILSLRFYRFNRFGNFFNIIGGFVLHSGHKFIKRLLLFRFLFQMYVNDKLAARCDCAVVRHTGVAFGEPCDRSAIAPRLANGFC